MVLLGHIPAQPADPETAGRAVNVRAWRETPDVDGRELDMARQAEVSHARPRREHVLELSETVLRQPALNCSSNPRELMLQTTTTRWGLAFAIHGPILK